jgi:hypothetical protein
MFPTGEAPAAMPNLRVAVVVDSAVVPAWIAALVTRLSSAATVEVGVFSLGAQAMPRRHTCRLGLGGRLERRLFGGRPDASAPVRIATRPLPAATGRGYDVVLDFGSAASEELAPETRYGAWYLTHGVDPECPHLYRMQIDALLADGSSVVVDRSYSAIDAASLHRTRNRVLWKAHGLLCNRLETTRRLGAAFIDSRPPSIATADPSPSQHRMLAIASAALGVARRRLRKLRVRETWFVAIRPRQPGVLAGLTPESPPGGFVPLESLTAVADPFVVDGETESYVFVEQVAAATGRGHIAFVRIGAEARADGPATAVLSAPYHLSYPFVFRYENETFMIPESSANGTVELYRATSFPAGWALEHVLLRGVRAFDPTLLVTDERLWLFVGMAEHGAAPDDELHLFSSPALLGPWAPHPANPVVSDVRTARPAGRIFRHGHDLIRPSQDCSRRYGHAIVLNRIEVLTTDEYRETAVGRIEPTWLPGLLATHTYGFGERVEVIDGKRAVARSLLGRRGDSRVGRERPFARRPARV